jgi:hypothetical protein
MSALPPKADSAEQNGRRAGITPPVPTGLFASSFAKTVKHRQVDE